MYNLTGDTGWLDRALAAFQLESLFEDFPHHIKLSSLTSEQLHDLRVIMVERKMYEAQKKYVKESKSGS